MYTILEHIYKHKKDRKKCKYCQERKQNTNAMILKSNLFN